MTAGNVETKQTCDLPTITYLWQNTDSCCYIKRELYSSEAEKLFIRSLSLTHRGYYYVLKYLSSRITLLKLELKLYKNFDSFEKESSTGSSKCV